jgi:hypothetical protein
MPIDIKRAVLREIRIRYSNSTKKEKGKILDEYCKVCKYTRKHAIRVLNAKIHPRIHRPGPRSKYNHPDVVKELKNLWLMMDQICSKKMKLAIPLWLPYSPVQGFIKELLLSISPSTIDRILKPTREPLRKGLSTTRASLIKSRIPLKLLEGDVKIPGYVEADTVAHCGNAIAGEYANSLTVTDLCSGWTENRAAWTKAAEGITEQFKDIEERLPFDLIGVATDNGSEFLNDTLYNYMKLREAPINMVRRRPYKKNDNAHVEQKNWTHVRRLFGYDRYENEVLIPLMNEIYRAYWNPLQNYFIPNMKLVSKERIGGRIKKKYDVPKTPAQRLLLNDYISTAQKAKIRENFETKNPFYLRLELDKKLKEFFDKVDEYKRLKRLTVESDPLPLSGI